MDLSSSHVFIDWLAFKIYFNGLNNRTGDGPLPGNPERIIAWYPMN